MLSFLTYTSFLLNSAGQWYEKAGFVMANDDYDLRSHNNHLLNKIMRTAYIVLVSYLFYKIIITQPEIFLNAQTFVVPWITFYVLFVFVSVSTGFIHEGRQPKTFLRQVTLTWLPYFGVGGVIVFYFLPLISPSLRMVFE